MQAISADAASGPRERTRPGIRPTDLTLMQQMRITEVEVDRRKELLDVTPADEALLTSCCTFIEDEIDEIVLEFFEIETAIDEVALLIGDADTLRHLHRVQRTYIIALFAGSYDIEYVNSRLRIGMVHKRIGVGPKLYLSAVRTLKILLRGRIGNHVEESERRSALYEALEKLLYFDTTLVFDTYIRTLAGEIEAAKVNAEQYASSLEEKVAERTRQLEEMSRRDALTGLYNHRSLSEFLRRDVLQAQRSSRVLSLVYLDIDHFKAINDEGGHHAGDEILQSLGRLLLSLCREVDVPCRYGGDEFCIILPDCTAHDAEKVCARLVAAFREAHPDVSLSIGIAQTGPDEFVDPSELVSCADAKMYEAKRMPGFQVRQ